jgi:RNA polymerase-binding transcription factor DksA
MTRDTESLRRSLTARLVELTDQVGRIEAEQREPLDDDFAEQAVAREDDEALDVIERSALAELGSIRQALERLDAGTYGICSACGDVIAPARLAALPAAALCIGCAAAEA